ncbi:MAG: ABC transporter substrate-binding protein [Treponema sp.]|nr:ABC transporter substrate-binding protein [Treponema sp.]
MKKALVILGVVLMLFSIIGCKKDQGLVVWSFTDELEDMIKNYYIPAHPDVKIEYTMTPTEQFQGRVDPVFQSGKGAPDIIALEADFVRKYVESGLLLDITDVYERNKSKLYNYPVEIGTYNGKVYGMSWQAAPGAFFYRRSLAKKYFGTDDPAVIQTYFSSFEKFLETAEFLKRSSNGGCVTIGSRGDLTKVFYELRSQPWVVGGRVNIDPAMEQAMDIAKIMNDNRYDGRVGQWSEGWFASFNGTLTDETGKQLETFGTFLPTWGLHYVLKTNAPDTSGDWAMIAGPVGWRWGGTWIGAYKDTKNVQAAKDMIEWLTTSDVFLERWARDKGDVVGSQVVVNKIKDTFREPFLGGQNHYAAFADMIPNVNGRLVQATDSVFDNLFNEAMTAYVEGEKTKAQALDDLRAQARTMLNLN